MSPGVELLAGLRGLNAISGLPGLNTIAGEVHVWVTSVDRPAAELDALGSTLAADERARAAEFCFAAHRQRFIVRRGLRREILAQYISAAPAELQFQAGANGKPGLLSDESVQFSCSHSRDVVVVAVARHRGVGVDVERLRPVAGALTIARELFPPSACAQLAAIPAGERHERFLIHWTRTEACVKATGEGLNGALADAATVSRWRVEDFAPAPGYVAAVAAEGFGWHVRLRQW